MRHRYSWLIFFFLLCGSASKVQTAIRPSFQLETCSWNATDIVVATEGKKIDGVFRVLEAWKGDLNPGDTIKVPELASFQSEASRVVQSPWYEKETKDRVIVTGERMVLFLKRDAQTAVTETASAAPGPTHSIKWKSASLFDEMSVSVVWIEEGRAFCFLQLMNPGPSLLVRLGLTEDELKNQSQQIKATQNSLLQAAGITNLATRAEALAPFAHDSLDQAREAAFAELKKVGPTALPVLRRLLADDSLLDIHAGVVEVLAETGKNDAAPDLVGLIKSDLEFWTRAGPILKKGWWNGEGFGSLEEVEPLRDRYSRDYEALLYLKKRPYRGSEASVTEFRDVWRSWQPLEEIGSDQMSKACDEVLAELDRLKASRNAIRFEGLQTFGESELLKALRDKGISTDDRSSFTPDLVDKARTAIQDYLAVHGFIHATTVAELDPASRALNFVIDEGERVGVAEIRFEGVRIFSSNELDRQMKQCLAGYDDGGYDSQVFDYCLHQLDNFVKSKGYLRASFHDPETREGKDGLVITVHADEGGLYKLGKITIEGSKFFSSDQIRATIGLKEGEIANGEKLSKALYEDLKKSYGNQGFIQYTAEITPTFKDNLQNGREGTVDFEVTIDEGKQFKLHSINFTGSDVPRKQLLDLLLIREGDVFNIELFEKSVEKLNESGLFDPIDKDKDPDFRTNEEEGLVRIVIKLTKRQN
jgi:hypothetical protein